jgi:biotin transporter BioY
MFSPPPLAEIADKMPAISTMWFVMGVVSLPFLVGLAHRKIALVLLPVSAFLSAWLMYWDYREVFLEGVFSEAIWSELGFPWVFNSFAACAVPLVVSAVVWLVVWLNENKQEETDCRPKTTGGDNQGAY